MSKTPALARLGSSLQEYQKLGINPDRIEPFEDGMRTDGRKGDFEWWYFDAHLADGSKLVITFYTKDCNQTDTDLRPYADIVLDRPDGTSINAKTAVFTGDEFSASTAACDVKIGPNRFAGDLHVYRIHIETKEVSADVVLTGEVPSWRPQTGHFFFEEDEHLYFAWLPSVPQGHVEVSLRIGEQVVKTSGIGYHDHNWGNVSMMDVINNWYWGRGQAGPYTVIACFLVAEARYGFAGLPIYMLAKNGTIVADDNTKVEFTPSDTNRDHDTGKPVADLLTYTYTDGSSRDVITWRRHRTILRDKFVDDISGIKRFMAKLTGFDGAYMRFIGELSVERYENGVSVDRAADEAIWELMYFGRTHET